MNKRLSRIEEKDISKISNSSQIEETIVERVSSAFWAQVARISRITLKEALRKNRRARELMIKIIDDNNKKKLERIIIKNLAKILRVKCDVVTSINRLQSDDIRVFTRSQKTKEILQKNIEWITIIIDSVSIKNRIFEMLIHDVRVKVINMIN